MAAHQAPPSLGFSRQEHWSGLPFPSPMHESEVAQLCPTLSDPLDCSLPGSSVHGIFQARVLEWGAIASGYMQTYFQSAHFNIMHTNSFTMYQLRYYISLTMYCNLILSQIYLLGYMTSLSLLESYFTSML